jgi:hypothetical protein
MTASKFFLLAALWASAPSAVRAESWMEVPFLVESEHPYAVKGDESVPLRIEGAKKIKLFFSRISVERGYDFLVIYDANGAEVERLTGEKNDYTSPEIEGDYASIAILKDDSAADWGFQVTKLFVQF